jgi:hypothetical protein
LAPTQGNWGSWIKLSRSFSIREDILASLGVLTELDPPKDSHHLIVPPNEEM